MFHRLTVPTYFGGLPGTHDEINNASSGTPAPASTQQSGGTYDGTYFEVPLETATAQNVNRANNALAENCDFIDDILYTSRPSPAVADFTAGGAETSRTITDDVFVGKVGTTNNQEERNRLIAVVDAATLEELTDASGTRIVASAIEDGAASNVVGQEASGFRTNPEIIFNVTIPVGVMYRLIYLQRGTVTAQSDPSSAGVMGDLTGRVLTNIGRQIAFTTAFTPALSSWADASQLSSTTSQNATDEIVDTLAATAPGNDGAVKIGCETRTGTDFDLSTAGIAQQLQEIIDNTTHKVGHTYTTGGLTFLGTATHILGPSVNNLNIQPGTGRVTWLRGQGGAVQFEVGDDQVGFFDVSANGNLRVLSTVGSAVANAGLEIQMAKDADANGDLVITRSKRSGTGTFASHLIRLIGQLGRDQTGAINNNDGGPIEVETGSVGTGGTNLPLFTDERGQHGPFRISYGSTGGMRRYDWAFKVPSENASNNVLIDLSKHGFVTPTNDAVIHIQVVAMLLSESGADFGIVEVKAGVYADLSLANDFNLLGAQQTVIPLQIVGGINTLIVTIQPAASATGPTINVEHSIAVDGHLTVCVTATATEDRSI